jgi:3-dehydroshikimate dehydratase
MNLQLGSMLAASLLLCSFGQLWAENYVVDRYQDDQQPGSLRWAIEQANLQPQAHHHILIQAVGTAPYVIKLKQPLPKIQAPMAIIGTAWQKSGDYIQLDGSGYIAGSGAKACPGANPGQYGTNVRSMNLPGLHLQDVDGVQLQGLDLHRFCIGVLLNRASNNLIQHNRISHNYGGAGIMITGDDGQGNPTSTTTNNNKVLDNQFIDNGDGLELTRGAAFNLIANNQFISTPANPEPSQGIEILWGNDNIVVDNVFRNYSDGLQINWGQRNYIAHNELSDNSIGLNLTGDGNLIVQNRIHDNRIGIALRSEKNPNAHIRLSQNQIWNNAKDIQRCQAGGSCVPDQELGAIVFAVPAIEHQGYVGSRGGGVEPKADTLQQSCAAHIQTACNAQPNQNLAAPQLSRHAQGVEIVIQAQPLQYYQVELFANRSAHASEAEHYLGSVALNTDAHGHAVAHWPLPLQQGSVTATLNDPLGASSALSRPLLLD